ncbi:MAG: hypothetical protein GF411_12245 [Candidatus Lokiarchaeota archaeon]|nr:hypothetical protein [Candidatus Lokiarchaeota archaeon]
MRIAKENTYLLTFIGAILVGFTIRMIFYESPFEIIISILGICIMIGFIVLLWTRSNPQVLWNKTYKCLAINRKFSVSVFAGCTLDSVPLGIDLSHSAKKVLRALSTRLNDDSEFEVSFFVTRPNNSSSTRVGLFVSRKTMRLLDGVSRSDSLLEQINQDVMTLQSALKTAYPHTPISRASAEDLILATNGGVLSHEV